METNNNLIKKLGSNDTATKTSTLKQVLYAATFTPKSEPFDSLAPFDQAKWVARLDQNSYCWSYGYRVQAGHNSKDCKGKFKRMQVEPTLKAEPPKERIKSDE